MTAQLDLSIMGIVRKDFTALKQTWTVEESLSEIRKGGLNNGVLYLYVLDDAGKLVGILPTRKLLTAGFQDRVADLMIRQVVAIPNTATVLEACEFFLMHKYLAFPVVDADRHVLGVAEIGSFTEEIFDMTEPEQHDNAFEALGFRVSSVRNASPYKAYALRFPWLLATIGSGTGCALLSSAFEKTLSKSLVLAFFLTMVLGLAESVSIQSMTVTIQSLQSVKPTWRWYRRALLKELRTALLMGFSCGLAVACIVDLLRGDLIAAGVIGTGICFSILLACLFGLSIPSLLHAVKWDPKIAAGPITLACTDFCALLFYFVLAWAVL